MKALIFAFLFLSVPIFANPPLSSRVKAHLTLGDFRGAENEVSLAMEEDPHSMTVMEAALEVYSFTKNEQGLLKILRKIRTLVSDNEINDNALMNVSWGVIRSNAASSSPQTRMLATLVAALTGDRKGVELILDLILDPNASIRALALNVCPKYPDHLVQQMVLECLKNDPVWEVKAAAIYAAGALAIKEAEPILKRLLQNGDAKVQGKAIRALSLMKKEVDRDEFLTCIESPRAAHRLLGCHLSIPPCYAEELLRLFSDPNSNVRARAIRSYFLHTGDFKPIRAHLNDRNPEVALMAAWALACAGKEEGSHVFERYFGDSRRSVRQFAAATLASAGANALPLMSNYLGSLSELDLKVNLAASLLAHRQSMDVAKRVIAKAVLEDSYTWMCIERQGLKAFVPYKKSIDHSIFLSKELMDQIVRLELIYMLQCIDDAFGLKVLREFLEKMSLVTGYAALLLLSEGQGEPFDLIQPLLDDPNPQVALQSAILLGIWNRSDFAIDLLEEVYQTSKREQKEQILEALGLIASPRSISFLLNVLNDSHHHLRLIASWSLLNCIKSK